MEMRAIKREDIPAFASDSPRAQMLKEFLESDAECVEIVHYGNLNSAASALRNAVSRTRLPVQILQRDKRLFMLKKDKDTSKEE